MTSRFTASKRRSHRHFNSSSLASIASRLTLDRDTPPSPPSLVTPPDTAASIHRAIKSLTSGSPVSRPGASFRRPESEPRPPHPDPSCAAEVASLAAFALSNRPCLPLHHASRSPHLPCPDSVARPSL